jgi:CSLREA domain-containing protein
MNKTIISLVLTFLLLGYVVPATTVYPASTTAITVNSTEDTISAVDNMCTLREAIIAANTDLRSGPGSGECPAGSASEMDTIIVPPGTYTLTITGQDEDDGLQGDLDVTSSMTIQGADPTATIIQAGTSRDDSVDRVIHVKTSSSVHIEGLTIQYGKPLEAYPNGGGILIQNSGTTTIDRCLIRRNELNVNVLGGGGGIANTGSGTLSIFNSAIFSNQALGGDTAYGGGIYNATGIINIANSTLFFNESYGSGGALFNFGGTAYLSNVTMTRNRSDGDDNGSGDGGGVAGLGTTYLKNSLLHNNDSWVPDNFPNISGNVHSEDYNIIADIGDEQDFSPAEHDIVGDSANRIDPDLGEFNQSSGSNQLLSTSLVLDQIPAESCTYQSGGSNPLFNDGESITRDQRGAPRPNGDNCDIGAREFYSLSVSSTEDTLADDGECTLREAITTANSGAPSGQSPGECDIPPDRISIPAGTYTLTIEGTGELDNLTGDLDILTDLILAGAGAQDTIIQAGPDTGGGIDRVLNIPEYQTIEIHNLTIRNGQTEYAGGGIFCDNSHLTIVNASISDNIADDRGGGIYCDEFCTIIIIGSSITGNQSRNEVGGGISVHESDLVIANSTVSNNQAALHGGGIYGHGEIFLSNTTVTSNIADSDQDGTGNGGGISFYLVWNLKNSIIAGNIDQGGEVPDVFNPHREITSLDYNLIGDIGTQPFEIGAHDIVGTSAFPEDPQLGELTGTPAYQVPEPGSRVIDAIPAISCTYTSSDNNKHFSDGEAITSDQTGAERPVDGDQDGHFACDIGAVEYRQAPPTPVFLPLVVNN